MKQPFSAVGISVSKATRTSVPAHPTFSSLRREAAALTDAPQVLRRLVRFIVIQIAPGNYGEVMREREISATLP